MSGLLLSSCDLEGQGIMWEKSLIQDSYSSILTSNLALIIQWEDQILPYYSLRKGSSALPEVISVSLACWGVILGTEKDRVCDQNTTTMVLMRMRTRMWEDCTRTHSDSVTHWENKLLFWVIQVRPGLPVSPQENWLFQRWWRKLQKVTNSDV